MKRSKWVVLVELDFFGNESLKYFDTHTGRLYSKKPVPQKEEEAPYARVIEMNKIHRRRRRRSSASENVRASARVPVSRSSVAVQPKKPRARSVRWDSNESPLVKMIDKSDMQGMFTPPAPFSLSKDRHDRNVRKARRDAPVHAPSPPSFSDNVVTKKKMPPRIPPPIVPRKKRPVIAPPPKPAVVKELEDVVLAPSLPSSKKKKKKLRPRPPRVPARRACSHYRLDMSADYGLCKCGFPKNEHKNNTTYYYHK